MKIKKSQLEKMIRESYEDVMRAKNEYRDIVRDALENDIDHLKAKHPDLNDPSLIHYLAEIIGSKIFNEKEFGKKR